MSSDRSLFQPPSRYPEPPRDMYYAVPERSSELPKPKPIFPWEAHAPRPTRVFPVTKAPSPPPFHENATETAPLDTPSGLTDTSQPHDDGPPTPVKSPDPWAGFQQRSNAWDDDPDIERYVQIFHQSRRGPIQVLHHTPSKTDGGAKSPREERRPSMKLTDFPTEVERPSLPVTPAPIRRPSFWGEERDESGQLPAAEGVPKQEDWVRRFSSFPHARFP